MYISTAAGYRDFFYLLLLYNDNLLIGLEASKHNECILLQIICDKQSSAENSLYTSSVNCYFLLLHIYNVCI